MKRLITAIITSAMLFMATTVFAIESKSPTWHDKVDGKYFIMKLAIVCDGAGAMAPYTMTTAFMYAIRGKNLTHIVWDPGATAPTNGMSIEIRTKSFGNADIMQGALAGLSSSTSAWIPVPVRDARILEQVIFIVSGNSVNDATFDLYLYFE